MQDVLSAPPTIEGAMKLMSSLMSLSKEQLAVSLQSRAMALQHMRKYMKRLALDVHGLSVIHVAGTKGKGSTCAFVESIIRQHGFKTGLYTSPHLISMEERFRVGGQPIAQETMLRHMYETYRDLEANVDPSDTVCPRMPSFFRFLTLVGFRVFLEERVDVLILETGMGGLLDATNVFPQPAACGITLIDYDHMDVLGDTLTLIATEKGGIIKPGVPTFCIQQTEEATKALALCARRAGTSLCIVPPLDSPKTNMGIAGHHQYANAALAVALSKQWLETQAETVFSSPLPSSSHPPVVAVKAQREGEEGKEHTFVLPSYVPPHLTEGMLRGLVECEWPGRCQTVKVSPRLTFYIDGAHTVKSMEACVDWFGSVCADQNGGVFRDILLFNVGSNRDPFSLLHCARHIPFHSMISCPFDSDRPRFNLPPQFHQLLQAYLEQRGRLPPAGEQEEEEEEESVWQRTLLKVWSWLVEDLGEQQVGALTYCASVREAIDTIHKETQETEEEGVQYRVLVVGSLYLAGNVLEQIKR